MRPFLRFCASCAFFRPSLLVLFAALAGHLAAQPANVQADPTTGALFRPAAATFISGNSLVTASSTTTLTNKSISGATNTLTAIPLTSAVTGTLPVANGGTGITAVGASGNVLTSNGTAWVSSAPTGGVTSLTGTAGQITVSASTGAVTLSLPATLTQVQTFSGGLIGKGTTTNDNAATGYIGEYVSSTITVGGSSALTNGVVKNVTSISLTAGDWDVAGLVGFYEISVTGTAIIGFSNNVSATFPSAELYLSLNAVTSALSSTTSYPIPLRRYSLSSTTTIYLCAYRDFTAGTSNGFGYIAARRVR